MGTEKPMKTPLHWSKQELVIQEKNSSGSWWTGGFKGLKENDLTNINVSQMCHIQWTLYVEL